MKLSFSSASPYVRKVRVVAHEVGLDGKIESFSAQVAPTKFNAEFAKSNPLAKVPALVLDGGEALYDSPVICEYLDHLGGGKLFPAPGPARWTALRRQALADGLLDAALLTRYEMTLRPENLRWKDWSDGQMSKITTALDALEAEASKLGGTVDIGTITIGCALGYLDFRFGDMGWRTGRPKIAAWFEQFNARPSMKATMPTG